MLTQAEVKTFQEAISKAEWELDLFRFAEVIGSDHSHDYTKDKFRQLNALSAAVNKFDAETLTKILNAVE